MLAMIFCNVRISIICRFYKNKENNLNAMNATTHANTSVYTIVNSDHFHEPVSFLIETMVAKHGKYIRVNSIKAIALAGLRELSAPRTSSELTITSLAGIPVRRDTLRSEERRVGKECRL